MSVERQAVWGVGYQGEYRVFIHTRDDECRVDLTTDDDHFPLCRAGWGGCVVSLIPASRERQFIAHLTDSQEGYSAYRDLGAKELETVVFKTVPGSGAGGKSQSLCDGREIYRSHFS